MTALASAPPIAPGATPIQPETEQSIEANVLALLAEAPPRSLAGLRMLQAVPSALAALRANMGRSMLTTLGIVIGVAAVIAIVALGEGANAQVTSQLRNLGTNVLTVQSGSFQFGGVQGGAGTQATLKEADAERLRTVPGVAYVSPVISGNAQIVAGNKNWSTRVYAVSTDYQIIQNWTIASGVFFSVDDEANAKNVAVLGDTAATNLFSPAVAALGQLIRIRNVPFTVVGVLQSKGSSPGPGGDQDDSVLIPFRTGQVRLFGSTSLNQIAVQVTTGSNITTVQQSVAEVMRTQHKLSPGQPDDFNIRNNADLVQRVSSVSETLTMLLGSVAAVSLVVGGIGIMNIMLVSVTERTREIGIRLAVGAHPNDILTQFMVEAVVLSAVGGIVGALIGSAVALLLPHLGWASVLPWSAIALAFGVSAAIGIFFGIYPARKAAQLDPIVALRAE